MDTQSYDVDRLFTTETGPSCGYDCPQCRCPTGKVEGDTWYHEYQDIWDINNNYAECALCECQSDGNGNLYASCNTRESYTVGSQSCPPTASESFSCHDQESSSSR